MNYEAKSKYSITIVATDDSAPEGRGTLDVTVTVKNAEDIGVVWPSQREPQVGTQVVATLEDDDGGVSNLEWQWYRNIEPHRQLMTTSLDNCSSGCGFLHVLRTAGAPTSARYRALSPPTTRRLLTFLMTPTRGQGQEVGGKGDLQGQLSQDVHFHHRRPSLSYDRY